MKEIIVKLLSPVVLFFFILATVGFDVHHHCDKVKIVLAFEASDCAHVHPHAQCHDSHQHSACIMHSELPGDADQGCHCVEDIHQLTVCAPLSEQNSFHHFACILPLQQLVNVIYPLKGQDYIYSFERSVPHSRNPHLISLRI